MLPNKKIWIRRETFDNELRCPLVPSDVGILVNLGFTVVVESCTTRCYHDEEFKKYGKGFTEKQKEAFIEDLTERIFKKCPASAEKVFNGID